MTHQKDASKLEQCAHVCHECQDACLRAIVRCLDVGGQQCGREHITLLTDCAAICQTSHNFLHRLSPHHKHTCQACAQICADCAQACDRMAKDDRIMQECAERCRRCAETCAHMAGM